MEEKIKMILAELKEDPNLLNLTHEADLLNEVGLDSLQMINFLLKLEDTFDIELDFDSLDYSDLRKLGQVEAFVRKHNTTDKN